MSGVLGGILGILFLAVPLALVFLGIYVSVSDSIRPSRVDVEEIVNRRDAAKSEFMTDHEDEGGDQAPKRPR